MLKKFFRDESGLEISEYAVAAALIALAVVTAYSALEPVIKSFIANHVSNTTSPTN